MQRFLIAILLISTAISCNKENPLLASSISQLKGAWELRKIVGGNAVTQMPDYKPGNGNLLIFTDSTIAEYFADTLYRTENYSLVMDTCWAVPDPPKMLPRFANPNVPDGSGVFLDVSAQKLIMYYGILASDGHSAEYTRLPD